MSLIFECEHFDQERIVSFGSLTKRQRIPRDRFVKSIHKFMEFHSGDVWWHHIISHFIGSTINLCFIIIFVDREAVKNRDLNGYCEKGVLNSLTVIDPRFSCLPSKEWKSLYQPETAKTPYGWCDKGIDCLTEK